MIKPNDERDVYFFMAYLAQKGEDSAFDFPEERADYKLTHYKWHHQTRRRLNFELQLSSEVMMPLSVEFFEVLETKKIEEMAEELVDSLDHLPLRKDELVDEILALREHAEAAFKKFGRRKTHLRLISLDFDLQESATIGEAAFRLTFEKLGSDARPVQAKVTVVNVEQIDAEIVAITDEQKILAGRAKELKKEKADGAIDAVLLNRLERHNLEIETVLRSPSELADDCVVMLPDGEIRLTWDHGVLTANMPLTDSVSWVCGGVNIRGAVPGIEGDLTGRKVSDIIKHPDLPDDLVVARGRARAGESVNFKAEMQYLLFDKESGLTW